MKNKSIFLLLATSVFVLLVFVVVSCKKYACFTVSDREECKKKCNIGPFNKKSYYYNDVNKECCCGQ